MEEKYDLQPDALSDGFGTEGDSDDDSGEDSEEEIASDDANDGY
jgi:hypothetical protein